LPDAKAKLREGRAGANRRILRKRDRTEQRHRGQHEQSVAGTSKVSPVALNRTAIGWQELARQAETDSRAYTKAFIRQIKETSLSKDVKANAVSVIEHSPLPAITC